MTLVAMSDQRIEHEPSITDRFLAYIEAKLDGEDIAGVHWQAKTLTSIGINSQEVRHGADFFGVLSLDLPGYRVQKGFLAQAKRVEPGQIFKASDQRNLRDQCQLMLHRSPVSYVFLYSEMSGMRVVSANDVLAATPHANPLDLTNWSVKEFFKAHLECFIGDYRVQAANRRELENLAADVRARNGIIIQGISIGGDIPPNRFR
jgi:hypothetical protein